jgi:hypothetical protein
MDFKFSKSLINLFKSEKDIQLVYIFGSVAKGRQRANSDVDIGILLNKSIKGEQALDYKTRFEERLSSILKKNVDIVFLKDAPPFLCYQVIKYGKAVFVREKKFDQNFRYNTMSNYFEYLPIQQFFVKKMQERLKIHGRHGISKSSFNQTAAIKR